MSGIELAGLVLGATPILIAAIDSYKGGISRLKSGFKRRKVVEKLGRALRYQKSIIEAITRNVLAQSGCDNIAGASDVQLRAFLQNKHTQEMVQEFLGPDNAQVFSDALFDCMADVSNATISLASLVPALTSVKSNSDVQAVLNANAASEKGQTQLLTRLSIIFNLDTLERQIEALDRSTDLLDKFTRNVTANHQPAEKAPSRKATKLAKVLKVVRENAIDLHSALARQWSTTCHKRHELKVFLEDRILELEPKLASDDVNSSCFKVIFVAGITQSAELWHETLFHVEADDSDMVDSYPPPRRQRLRFQAAQPRSREPRLTVPDICAAITDAADTAHHPIFYLGSSKNMAMTLHTEAIAMTQSSQSSSTTLQQILQDRCRQNPPSSPLPWKWRMILALKIASSFLQFTRTPWVQPSWSASNIHIPYIAGSHELDLSRPFLSTDFNKDSSPPAYRQPQVKEDLLELGILLLEIWDENKLETQFAEHLSTKNTSFLRRACAIQWLEDLQNSLPDLYFRAASHCISGSITHDPRASEWDHPDIRQFVCEHVIDPLSKVAQI